jgi:hypothetical protein
MKSFLKKLIKIFTLQKIYQNPQKKLNPPPEKIFWGICTTLYSQEKITKNSPSFHWQTKKILKWKEGK